MLRQTKVIVRDPFVASSSTREQEGVRRSSMVGVGAMGTTMRVWRSVLRAAIPMVIEQLHICD